MKEPYTITLSSGGRTVTVSGADFSGLAKSLQKEEKVDNCPRCHGKDFRQWHWLGRVMNKCLRPGCGRIWSWNQ